MNTSQEISRKGTASGPLLEKDHGYFNSQTVMLSAEEVFSFCQDLENVKKVLNDLPVDVENFLDLNLVSAEQTEANEYKIQWSNKANSKFSGNVIFLLKTAPMDRGTYLTAEASFAKFNFREEGPSNLMNVFLKRFKQLMETGEIASIKGQPSGREEIKASDERTLH
jgi:hypothetical protein